MYQQLVEGSQNENRRFKKNLPSSLFRLQQQEEPYNTMKEARELRRRREDSDTRNRTKTLMTQTPKTSFFQESAVICWKIVHRIMYILYK